MDNQDDGTRIYNVLEIRDLSITADVKATNPGFSTHTHEYMENCQWCVVAYKARRRGYNVVAKPRILSSIDPLPYMTNPLGWPAVYKNRRLESCAADTGELAKKKVEALMKSYGDKSRAVVKVDWFMRNRGHLFIAENQDDVIYFVDPQTGSLDAAWYFRYINPHSVIVMRTDQTNFTELVNLCFD